jgi:hypothetical protein
MQLIIKNDTVIAVHEDSQNIAHLYPGTECVAWHDRIKFDSMGTLPPDPRTQEQKDNYYKDERRVAYPSVEDQLDMLYHDTVEGTGTWVVAITEVKERFPKPMAAPQL